MLSVDVTADTGRVTLPSEFQGSCCGSDAGTSVKSGPIHGKAWFAGMRTGSRRFGWHRQDLQDYRGSFFSINKKKAPLLSN